MGYYRTCPECGANNDPWEPCDCAREEPGRECLEEGQDEKK